MIETPRRVVYDWFGRAGDEPRAGSFLVTVRETVYRVLSVRPVAVRVTRGETSRLSLELVRWHDDIPSNATCHELHWNSRG
jgi:hypothetical protein